MSHAGDMAMSVLGVSSRLSGGTEEYVVSKRAKNRIIFWGKEGSLGKFAPNRRNKWGTAASYSKFE